MDCYLLGMRIDLSTPALLFPAVSLLMLAYTNRFLALANIIRNLSRSHAEKPNPNILLQIRNMRTRIRLIREMQTYGVVSIILCVTCMFLLFRNHYRAGEWVFGASMACMLISLGYSLVEIRLSGRSLDLHLQDLEKSGSE